MRFRTGKTFLLALAMLLSVSMVEAQGQASAQAPPAAPKAIPAQAPAATPAPAPAPKASATSQVGTAAQSMAKRMKEKEGAAKKAADAKGDLVIAKRNLETAQGAYKAWCRAHPAMVSQVEAYQALTVKVDASPEDEKLRKAAEAQKPAAGSQEEEGLGLLRILKDAEAAFNAATAAYVSLAEEAKAKDAEFSASLEKFSVPPFLAFQVFSGIADLGLSQGGSGTAKATGARLELGAGGADLSRRKPDGTLYGGFWLPGMEVNIFGADPVVTSKEVAGTSPSVTTTTTTDTSKWSWFGTIRLMRWHGFWGDEGTTEADQEKATGLILGFGRESVTTRVEERTPQASGSDLVKTYDPQTHQKNVWRVGLRREWTPSSNLHPFQGSFMEIGYARDTEADSRRGAHRFYLLGRLVTAIFSNGDPKSANRLFVDVKVTGGYGQRDTLGVVVAYQANLSDWLGTVGF